MKWRRFEWSGVARRGVPLRGESVLVDQSPEPVAATDAVEFDYAGADLVNIRWRLPERRPLIQ